MTREEIKKLLKEDQREIKGSSEKEESSPKQLSFFGNVAFGTVLFSVIGIFIYWASDCSACEFVGSSLAMLFSGLSIGVGALFTGIGWLLAIAFKVFCWVYVILWICK